MEKAKVTDYAEELAKKIKQYSNNNKKEINDENNDKNKL